MLWALVRKTEILFLHFVTTLYCIFWLKTKGKWQYLKQGPLPACFSLPSTYDLKSMAYAKAMQLFKWIFLIEKKFCLLDHDILWLPCPLCQPLLTKFKRFSIFWKLLCWTVPILKNDSIAYSYASKSIGPLHFLKKLVWLELQP